MVTAVCTYLKPSVLKTPTDFTAGHTAVAPQRFTT